MEAAENIEVVEAVANELQGYTNQSGDRMDLVRRSFRPDDIIRNHLEDCRNQIAEHEKRIIQIEEARGTSVKAIKADLAEAKRAYEEHAASLRRKLSETNETANQRISISRKMIASNKAALSALEAE